jgi:hypothetical protein
MPTTRFAVFTPVNVKLPEVAVEARRTLEAMDETVEPSRAEPVPAVPAINPVVPATVTNVLEVALLWTFTVGPLVENPTGVDAPIVLFAFPARVRVVPTMLVTVEPSSDEPIANPGTTADTVTEVEPVELDVTVTVPLLKV